MSQCEECLLESPDVLNLRYVQLRESMTRPGSPGWSRVILVCHGCRKSYRGNWRYAPGTHNSKELMAWELPAQELREYGIAGRSMESARARLFTVEHALKRAMRTNREEKP